MHRKASEERPENLRNKRREIRRRKARGRGRRKMNEGQGGRR